NTHTTMSVTTTCVVQLYCDPRVLHSFPTRRSSDLGGTPRLQGGRCCRKTRTTGRPGSSRALLYRSQGVRSRIAWMRDPRPNPLRSEEHTSELQSRENLVCRLLLEKKKEVNC